jgi:hypothetical protein
MLTNRQFISDIRSLNKILSSDSLLNDRSILREGKTVASLLIKQQVDKRKLFQSPNLFTNINCLEMIKVPLAECCEYSSDKYISRSKQKLPTVGEGLFGLLVQGTSSADGLQKFNESTPMRYSNILKLNLPVQKVFFWIYNNYLYVTNPNTKIVRFSAYFEDTVPNEILYPDCDCSSEAPEDPCISDLDKEFKCAPYLLEAVKSMTYKKLLEIYFQLPKDSTDDDNDEQSK